MFKLAIAATARCVTRYRHQYSGASRLGDDVTPETGFSPTTSRHEKYVIRSRDFWPMGFEKRHLKTVTSNMAAVQESSVYIP